MFQWIDELAGRPEIQEVAMYGNKLHLTVKTTTEAERAIREVSEHTGLQVISLREITPSLEDIFVSVMTRQR